MNTFANEMKKEGNFTLTENCAVSYESTLNKVLDLFALGGSYRERSEDDCILLFKEAFEEDKLLALKCLFYLRDFRGGGQGERRFFRVCYNWLAKNYPIIADKNIRNIPDFGRFDDLYCMMNTPLQNSFLNYLKYCISIDLKNEYVSLCSKWLPSENASSRETKMLAKVTREHFGMTAKEYRKTLSSLRKKIKLVESQMSQNRWDEIDFSKIPSNAGMKYRYAFARRDETHSRYVQFLESKETKVNASVLYPHNIIRQAFRKIDINSKPSDPDRLSLQKYWDNLPDYYNGRQENGIAVIDVSGSMYGTPLEAAVSMGLYIVEKSHGPFANSFITFSARPQIINVEGIDICNKAWNCKGADWGMNTDIEAVFDLLLNIALRDNVKQEDIPDRVYIFSDMEFDEAVSDFSDFLDNGRHYNPNKEVLFDKIKRKWEVEGYKIPNLVFWNLNARSNQIPCIGEGISYVSGFSPSMIDCILGGKTGWELCLEKLNSERYSCITI